MALESGTKLGHYEITDQIGKGGMGEVYRARDTKLGREVAIKVLPSEFSQDADRLARLEREARMLAALNHPNIAAIYGLEQSDDTRFLVLELVEGDTLAERLKKGAIPVEESLKLALQIAEALEAAHEKGVIHRDLKPANIKITPEGRVKVLDFGLAKAFIGDRADVNLSNSPTLSMTATQAGIILGTAAYMSPEQASGETADQRTDVWAFGVVLFEMLSGRPLFTGKTASHVMGAVLEREPDWNSLPARLHPLVRELLERCLEKEAKNRRQTIADVRFDLRKVLDDPAGVTPAPGADVPPARSLSGAAWLALTIALAAVAVLAAWNLKPGESGAITRLSVTLPQEQSLVMGGTPRLSLAISPDGRRVIYRGRNEVGARSQLYMRLLDELSVEPLPGTDGAFQPFFSPDGSQVAFFTDSGRLQKLRLDGGAPVTLASGLANSTWRFGVWSDDDTIYFTGSTGGGIQSVPADGSAPPSPVTVLDTESGEASHGLPSLVPETGDLLFTITYMGDRDPALVLQPRDSGERVTVLENAGNGIVTPSGHLIFTRPDNDAMFIAQYDPEGRRVTGPAEPLGESFARDNLRVPQLAISRSGILAYVPDVPLPADPVLGWVERDGMFSQLGAVPQGSRVSGISPDGTSALIERAESGNNELLEYDFERRIATPVYASDSGMGRPRWHPDGRQVTLTLERSVKLRDLDSGQETELVALSAGGPRLGSWSKAGDALAFTWFNPDESIYAIVPGDSEPHPVVVTEAREHSPVVSPDGNWIAYVSNESGRDEVWIARFPEGVRRQRISDGGGSEPLWRSDGGELFFRALDESEGETRFILKAVRITPGDTLEVGGEAILFPLGIPNVEEFQIGGNTGPNYDVSSDGSRFLMLRQTLGRPLTNIVIVQNWFTELRERVPVD